MEIQKYLFLALVLSISLGSIVNHKVIRSVNFDGPNSVYLTSIEILNDGPEGSAEVKSYQIALNASIHQNLVNFQVTQEDQKVLKVTELKNTLWEGFVTYVITLDTPIRPGVKSKI